MCEVLKIYYRYGLAVHELLYVMPLLYSCLSSFENFIVGMQEDKEKVEK